MSELVADVLRRAGIAGPPTRLPLIANLLGMMLRPDPDLPKGWDAVLTRGEDLSLCSYDPRRSSQRVRFSVAHEVGHLLLHEGKGYLLDGNWLDPADERRLEREADAFAAELLMPKEWVFDACLAEPSFDDLRDLFWVSRPAMKRRLDMLNIRIPVTTYETPAFTRWNIRDHAYVQEFYGGQSHDPYEDYLRMRGVLEVVAV